MMSSIFLFSFFLILSPFSFHLFETMPPEGDPKTLSQPTLTTVHNWINGSAVPPSSDEYLPIESPMTGEIIGSVALSADADVHDAVSAAAAAFPAWSALTMKARAAIMLRFHNLVNRHASELAELIVLENGKNITEALADVAKGNETVEYACSLPQLAQGRILRVSSDVTCQDRRDPLGVVASIVPFNFPFMVPMWTLPIALVTGNTIVLKPSEKVPLTMYKTMELLMQAGVPNGVVNLIQGTKRVVEALIDHPQVRAVTFVGSSPVASLVSLRCRNLNKRCCALGGAKNHLVTLPDCDIDSAARDIVASFAGCAGQRCMAASVLLMVGGDYIEKLLAKVTDIASRIQPGNNSSEQGPVIDAASLQRILSYIHGAETSGCKIILDGRKWTLSSKQGYWIGPTIVMHSSPHDVAMVEEIFGPVLSVYQVSSWTDAIKIENDNPYGNAACVYTTSGASGDWFTSRFRASMLGINIGIPVPREPFSFGGLYGTKSKYGDMDITGDGAIEFFSNRIKVSTRWPVSTKTVEVSQSSDYANFAGQM